ncbi:hypothetical protein HII28_02125 [Planctomonas sp. JC2975]|uniref:hypothetical protein n=1 Tax=Planctomonas sp. JC2975 TaxID=2729626 RepID=UPI0014732C2C|nr:hypothetical protein [Planctomonas sp. JC2975]NNC10684.1 hypothetical protein [Planctomonas sp. JC2975]
MMATPTPRTLEYTRTLGEFTETVLIPIQHGAHGDIIEVTPEAMDTLLRAAGYVQRADEYVI